MTLGTDPVEVKVVPSGDPSLCCVVSNGKLGVAPETLSSGEEVKFSVSEEVDCEIKVSFPNKDVFGVEYLKLTPGDGVVLPILYNGDATLAQDFVVFCMMSGKTVMNDDGTSPTIIIGG